MENFGQDNRPRSLFTATICFLAVVIWVLPFAIWQNITALVLMSLVLTYDARRTNCDNYRNGTYASTRKTCNFIYYRH